MQDVGRDVQRARPLPAVERVPGDRWDGQERQRADEGPAPEPAVDERDRRQRRSDDRDDSASLIGHPEADGPWVVVRDQRSGAQEHQ